MPAPTRPYDAPIPITLTTNLDHDQASTHLAMLMYFAALNLVLGFPSYGNWMEACV